MDLRVLESPHWSRAAILRGFHQMTGWPFGKCQRCGVTVFPFALSCPSCHAPSLRGRMAAVAGLAAVLLGAGLIALAWHTFRGTGESKNPTSVLPTPSASGPRDTAQAYDWIVKAMAQCEEEAKLSPDTLRFLIVPVITTGLPQPGWSPSTVGTIGQVGALLQATDTVIGLRNGALVLYQGPVTFAVSDPATNTVYKWKPAAGVSELKARQIDSTRLTLGLEIPDRGKAIEWGPTITLRKGSCYWINPLLRATNE